MIPIRSLTFDEPPIDLKEIFRYISAKETDETTLGLVESCLNEVRDRLEYKACYVTLPVSIADDRITVPSDVIESQNLAKNLGGCDSMILFAATVGIGIDRLISRYSLLSPAKAMCFQAIGAERVESLCDALCQKINAELKPQGKCLRPRFSPGYGDLPLETQKTVFTLLDCPRKIGVTLGDSLLMTPSKSVTAFAGITNCQEVTI